MKKLLILLVLLPATLQAQLPNSVAQRRREVESSLLPQIVSPGEEGYDIRERMAEHGVPGLSIAVINDGKVEWAAGYGVKRLGEDDPVTTSSLFQAASISKPFTAVATLRQVEEGVLELDRDVSEYLRSWTLPEGTARGTRPSSSSIRRPATERW